LQGPARPFILDPVAAKVVVIAGAGPNLGLSLARAFGAKGFRVALVARRKAALESYVFQLKKAGVDAYAYQGDVEDEKQLEKAFAYIRQDLGPIDLLEFSPSFPADTARLPPTRTTEAALAAQCKTQLLGAAGCVRRVLPEMLERRSGTLLFTTCGLSVRPSPAATPVSVAMTALRTYALCLYSELAPLGVFAAHVSIAVELKPGSPEGDPARVAALYAELSERRDRPELIVAPAPAAAAAPKPA